jgi:membrane protease YdiL (CAAX protease family)
MTQPPPGRPFLARVLLSPTEPRLRAGWRILLHLLILVGLMGVFSALLGLFFYFFQDPPPALVAILSQLATFLAITLAVYLARRFLDRRSFGSLGLPWDARAAKDLLAGIGIAGVLLGLVFLAEWAVGWLVIEGFAWQQDLPSQLGSGVLTDLAIFIFVGWNEELLTRGYWLWNLAEGLNMHWAVIITSTLFAILHLWNPNASPIIVLGLTTAGLFFAFAVLWTRRLWLPIGLHIGWNFFEGTVFGFPVSGTATYRLIRHTVTGPEWITGGDFGPEAGTIILAALAAGFILIYLYARSQKAPKRLIA